MNADDPQSRIASVAKDMRRAGGERDHIAGPEAGGRRLLAFQPGFKRAFQHEQTLDVGMPVERRGIAGLAGLHAGEHRQPVLTGELLVMRERAERDGLGFGEADDPGFGGRAHGEASGGEAGSVAATGVGGDSLARLSRIRPEAAYRLMQQLAVMARKARMPASAARKQ